MAAQIQPGYRIDRRLHRTERHLSGSKSYGEEQLVIGRRNESDTGTAREETITYLEDESWSSEIDEFADAITKNGKIVCGTAEDALKTMELVYRIYSADPVWRENYVITDPKGS